MSTAIWTCFIPEKHSITEAPMFVGTVTPMFPIRKFTLGATPSKIVEFLYSKKNQRLDSNNL